MTRVIPLTTLAIAVVMTTTAQAATVLITGTTRAESYRIGPEQRRSVFRSTAEPIEIYLPTFGE